MSIEIYYYSGTGNSLHIAKELHKRLPGSKLIPIIGLLKNEHNQSHTEIVGFVTPQNASSFPKLILKFIADLNLESTQYIFAILTRGGTETRGLIDLDSVLLPKGKKVDSFFPINMPSGSDPILKNFDTRVTQEKIARLESAAMDRLDVIQNIIRNRKTSREKDTTATTPTPGWLKPFEPFLQKIAKSQETKFDFYADSKCASCGSCEKICLSQKIKMVDGKPFWQEEVDCYGCWACLNYCPQHAIQIKSKWYLKSYTPQNGRYHHPAISADDIAAQKKVVRSNQI